MGIKPSEISALIKEQIKNYAHEMEQNDVGTIVSVGDGVALIYGLDKAMYGELLEFPNDVYGLVMNLEEEHVGAVLLGDSKSIKEGDVVKRTNKIMEVPVGDALIGRVVNALGQPIDGLGPIASSKTRPIERVASGVMTRKSVSVPLGFPLQCPLPCRQFPLPQKHEVLLPALWHPSSGQSLNAPP